MKILVLTHNYPRFPSDHSGVFFVSLLNSLENKFKIKFNILVPTDPKLVHWDSRVVTFNVSPEFAYEGQMQRKMVQSPFKALKWLFLYIKNCEKNALIICKENPPDVIWAQWLIPSGIIAYRVSKKTGIPYILTSHGTDLFLLRKYPFLYRFFKHIARGAKQWSVVSKPMAHIINRLDTHITPLIRPLGYNSTTFTEFSNIKRDNTLFLAAGSIIKRKNFELVIEAIVHLRERGIPANLVIIGDGPEKNNLIRTRAYLNAWEYIKILPACSQEELAKWFNHAHAFVMPSVDEGLGMVYLEAMACGCPCIGLRKDGTIDAIRHGFNGLLVNSLKVNELADVMENIYRDSTLWETLHRNAPSSVESFAIASINSIGQDLCAFR